MWACGGATALVATLWVRPSGPEELALVVLAGLFAAAAYGGVVVPVIYDGATVVDRDGRWGDPGDRIWFPREELPPPEDRPKRRGSLGGRRRGP